MVVRAVLVLLILIGWEVSQQKSRQLCLVHLPFVLVHTLSVSQHVWEENVPDRISPFEIVDAKTVVWIVLIVPLWN